ncbi:hypothetical protein SEA_ZOOMAN_171 [Microbacterium phage Zooman]|nr:hypothetical protein SEA_ZOOMAN_171 [Microbacterium phage Zooman]
MSSRKTQDTRLRALAVARAAFQSQTVTQQGVTFANSGPYTVDQLLVEAKKVEAYLNA